MPTTYKSSANPYFYQEQFAKVGQLAQPFIERRRQRDQEEKDRAMGRVDIALQAVAAGGNPQDSAVEAALRDLEKIDPGTAESMRGLIRAMSAPKPKDPGEAALERMIEIAQAAKNEAMNPPGQGVLLPEVYQRQVQQGAQTPPGQFFDQARSQMGLGEQMQAAAFAKKQGMPLPEPPEPPKLPADIQALKDIDKYDPDVQKAIRAKTGLELTASQQALEDYRAKADRRAERALDLQESRESGVQEREKSRYDRETRKLEAEMTSDLADILAKTNLEERKDWQQQVDAQIIRPKSGDSPPRPPAFLRTHARRVAEYARSLVEKEGYSDNEAFDLALGKYRRAMELMAESGQSADAVLDAILQ